MPGPLPAADRGGATLQRFPPHVAELEFEVDRLRCHNRLVHQDVLGAPNQFRDLCKHTARRLAEIVCDPRDLAASNPPCPAPTNAPDSPE
jgi:hypothetical protein